MTCIIRNWRLTAAADLASALSDPRVLEAGFRCEGTLRQNAVKNGNVLDMKLYALLKML